jgi:hypothetical protein
MQKAQMRFSSIKQTRNPRLSEYRADAVPGSAGISARETPCVCLVSFKHASRAEMPALPGLAGCVTSVNNQFGNASGSIALKE